MPDPVLTRQGLTSALAGLRPGPQAGLHPSASADHAGAASAYIGIVAGGIINPTGIAVTIHGSKTHVTSTARLWQKAPSDGIPRTDDGCNAESLTATAASDQAPDLH